MQDLLEIMRLLRSPDGCPWDREQTHQSIRSDFLEETHEAIEAIDRADTEGLREELGDVLLQVVFHAQIAAENGEFGFDDVVNALCQKLLQRHPHVFGDSSAQDAGQALQNWDAVKRRAKGGKKQTQLLDGVPHSLPALMRASKVMSRAKRVGLDLSADTDAVLKTARRQLEELPRDAETAMGNLLFSLVALSRSLHIDAEEAVSLATNRFIDRFSAMEQKITADGGDIGAVSAAQWQALWEEQYDGIRCGLSAGV